MKSNFNNFEDFSIHALRVNGANVGCGLINILMG